ncbi:MAG: DUF2065 domain-containing protein [Rhodoferax sp.]|nr:DUF2065 domain-containing protein [Rhodoferax sp.]
MTSDTIWLALALVLIIEGLLPFATPNRWRQMFTQVLALRDGQIRFIGMLSILGGMLIICWLNY